MRLVEECLHLVRMKQDFDQINNLIDRYKTELADFYDEWADDFSERAVRVTNEGQWLLVLGMYLAKLERRMTKFGRERLAEAFGLGLAGEMTERLDYELQKQIAVNDTWVRNSLVPNVRLLSESYWEERDDYPEKDDVKGIWLRRAYQVGLYAGAAWTAFWAGRVYEQPPDTYWKWNGPADHVSCSTCLERVGRIYRADQLPGLPGDQSTSCGCNCRCWCELLSAEEASEFV